MNLTLELKPKMHTILAPYGVETMRFTRIGLSSIQSLGPGGAGRAPDATTGARTDSATNKCFQIEQVAE